MYLQGATDFQGQWISSPYSVLESYRLLVPWLFDRMADLRPDIISISLQLQAQISGLLC